jgi:hypothetical protein
MVYLSKVSYLMIKIVGSDNFKKITFFIAKAYNKLKLDNSEKELVRSIRNESF